jgi:ABC-type uncharacterized transport system substrate-binding protein
VLVNPANVSSTEATLQEIGEAARSIGLQILALNASTGGEIEAAFGTLLRERADALFVAADPFFFSQPVQFGFLAVRHGIPMAHSSREAAEAGALMSYAPDGTDMFRQSASTPVKSSKAPSPPIYRSRSRPSSSW